jgi:thioredoxin-related protein
MTPVENIFGQNCILSKGKDSKTVKEAMSDSVKLLGLYFSRMNCPPCTEFTPCLSEIYSEVNEEQNVMEIVYIGGEKTKEKHDEYANEMPWFKLAFDAQKIKEIREKFGVKSYPHLTMISAKDGKVIQG